MTRVTQQAQQLALMYPLDVNLEASIQGRREPPNVLLTEDEYAAIDRALKARSQRLERYEAKLSQIYQLTLGVTAALIPFLIWGVYNQDLRFSVVVFVLMAMSSYLCWVAKR